MTGDQLGSLTLEVAGLHTILQCRTSLLGERGWLTFMSAMILMTSLHLFISASSAIIMLNDDGRSCTPLADSDSSSSIAWRGAELIRRTVSHVRLVFGQATSD